MKQPPSPPVARRRTRLLILLLYWLLPVAPASAQAPTFRYELLSLLPDDFAVCVVMHDLRGHAERWGHSAWFEAFRRSPAGKAFLEAPELQQLKAWEKELKKHFGVDGVALRDEIFGDTVLLSYSGGPANRPEDERGLFLVHTHKPDRLTRLLDQLNDIQKRTGELKSLTPLRHKGQTYHRRVQGDKTQFYFLDGPLLAFSPNEDLVRGVLERRGLLEQGERWKARFRRAGADEAFAVMAINPRAIAPDFVKDGKKDDGLPGYWQALEGIFVTLTIRDAAELRVSVQADVEALPAWARTAFMRPQPPSALWAHFPESALFTFASHADFAGAADALQHLIPEKERKHVLGQLQRGAGALLGQDLFRDVLPNLGPDWGGCVLPAKDAARLPDVLFALRIKPGTRQPPVDQSLFKATEFFARLLMFEYNKDHPDEIRLQTLKQDGVDVNYLTNDKLFPAGVRPAWALKDGYLIFASSPASIEQFRARNDKPVDAAEGRVLHLSPRELGRLLRQRGEAIVANLKRRQGQSEDEARKHLDNVVALLDLFDRLEVRHGAGAGQASWTLRLAPAAVPTKE